MTLFIVSCTPAQEGEGQPGKKQPKRAEQSPAHHDHQASSGKPLNRLSKESSPYLRQHQHNPVDWYPWGPDALALAKKLDRPIFLSIGYSACHWCHVMAAESFSDADMATLMNERFVCIKVDREERPDIDEIYMGALHAMGQQGGWPLSAWLTPDGKPFYGGTYFPLDDQANRTGFRRVCTSLADAWRDRRDEVVQGAKELSDYLQRSLAPKLAPGEPTAQLLEKIIPQALERYDSEYGGFAYPPRRAPKFPHATELQVLMRLATENAEEMTATTLHSMRRGGIHDQIGGGFHRYSTDRQWLVPHFEKMLYDNALLVPCYLEGFLLHQEPRFAEVARTTLDYILRELQAPLGGFWSSQDAQSEGVEGKYFVWQLNELKQNLGDDFQMVAKAFGVTEEGNWEHQNVLWAADEAIAASESAKQQLRNAKQSLFDVREQRIKPGTDDKIITSWNGLTLTALANGYRVLGDARYLEAAQKCANFLLRNLVVDGRAMRIWHGGKAQHQGYLEDYVALAGGLLTLFEADSNPRWLLAARNLLKQTDEHFRAEDGAFWFTADDHEELIARTKTVVEGATPSGNALAAAAFLRAGLLLGDEQIYEIGVAVIRAYQQVLDSSPAAAPSLMLAAQFHMREPKEVIVVGEFDDARTKSLLQVAWNQFPQMGVVTLLHSGNREEMTEMSPVFRNKEAINEAPTAYVCNRGTCLAPINDPTKLRDLLKGRPVINAAPKQKGDIEGK